RRVPGRAGGDGARAAPRAHEHVHRAGAQRPLRGRREPRRDRSPGAPGGRARPRLAPGPYPRDTHEPNETRRIEMLLATTQVEDFDRFMKVFTNEGAEKR